MDVITISRLVGSGGTAIGKEVAKQLDYKYVDMEIIHNIMNQYGETEFKKIYDSRLSMWDRYSGITDEVLEFFKRIMLSIAKYGKVVIVGRGSFVSLGKYGNVLDVMVYAPMDTRIMAIMKNRGFDSMEKAEKYIINKEKIRQSFIEATYNIQWNQIDNFDLVYNTGKLDSSFVIESIVKAARARLAEPITSGILTSDIPEDKILDGVVKKYLEL
jgi:cytidylate kinase